MEVSENLPVVKPNLLIILNRFVIGGQAVDTIPLAYELKAHFNVLLLYGEKEADEIEPAFLLELYPGLQLQKIKHLRRSVNPLTDLIAFFKLLSAIKNFKADVVHTHGAKSGVLGRAAAWIAGVPVIVHTFHGHFFHSYFSKNISRIIALVERSIGKITTAAIALSEAQKHDLVHVFRIMPFSKMKIIPLGFAGANDDNRNLQRKTFREKYNIDDETVAIGIVGRIVPVKNHQMFLQVIAQLLQQSFQQPVAFFIVGDGHVRPRLEALLNQMNIAHNQSAITSTSKVVFTSWITNMNKVMNGLDIIALTSLNEGTPLSIIEAQFYKRPVVSTNVGGVKNAMLENETGFLVASNDVAAFTEKIALLINDHQLRKAMGEKGFAFISEKYSKQAEVENTMNFYFSLLAQQQEK